MMIDLFWLNDDGDPIPYTSKEEFFAGGMGSMSFKHIGLTSLCGYELGRFVIIEPIIISTVFLGIDYAFHTAMTQQPPILFESMIFGGAFNEKQARYSTMEEAQDGHQRMVRLARLGRWVGRRLATWWINK